jgi:DNA repair protein RecO
LSLESFEASSLLFGLAADPTRLGRASYLVEVTERLLPAAEPAPALFASLEAALAQLSSGEADARLLRAFELRLLDETGYLPDLGSASDAPERAPAFLDKKTGALTAAELQTSVPFGRDAQEACAALLASPFEAPPPIDAATLREVSRLFATHLRLMGVSGLKSVAFLRTLPP